MLNDYFIFSGYFYIYYEATNVCDSYLFASFFFNYYLLPLPLSSQACYVTFYPLNSCFQTYDDYDILRYG
jgi:hypothetical protein